MRTIIFNSGNIVPNVDGNNTLVYNFNTSMDLTGCEVAVSQVFLYYSWDNINRRFINNIFRYVWIDDEDNEINYTVEIPDGLYEISDINSYLQFIFIQNGHYLVNDVGDFVYFAELVVNPNRYAIQINTYPVPIVLPQGWSNPSGFDLPTQTFNPKLIIPSNFNKIVGYPENFETEFNIGDNSNLSYLSSKAPNVQPNSNILFTLQNIDNKYASPTSIIYSMAPNVQFGALIQSNAPNLVFNKFQPGYYSSLRLQILGLDLQPLNIRDPNMSIIVVIKEPNDLINEISMNSTNGQEIMRRGINQNNMIGSGLYRR